MKLSRLPSFSTLGEVASIWIELAITDLRLKCLPWRMNRDFVFKGYGEGDPARPEPEPVEVAEIGRLSRLVATAARFHFVFTMTCLRRSLVLRSRLERAGIASTLVFGAGRNKKTVAGAGGVKSKLINSFIGHAWLDVGGMAVDTYGTHGHRRVFRRNGQNIETRNEG